MKRTKYYEDKQESPFNKGAGARSATGGSLKDHKGITLIALIITIIVMLILVAVTITVAVNGGLFEHAGKAVGDTQNSIDKEQTLANGKIEVDGKWYNSIDDYIAGKCEGYVPTYAEAKFENGVLTENATYTSGAYTAVIPKGFKIIEGLNGSTSIADGLVISDASGNEFVWIPVNYTATGILDENELDSGFLAVFYRSAWSNNARTTGLSTDYTEPYASGYTTPEGKTESEEYYEMMRSVQENKGFYIGRYEAGSTTPRTRYEADGTTEKANGKTEMVVKRDAYPYNYVGWGSSMINYTDDVLENLSGKNQGKGALLLSKELYGKAEDVGKYGVVSTLCYGVQWDAMLDFIKEDKDVTNSKTWGNYWDNQWTITRKAVKYSEDGGQTWNLIDNETDDKKVKTSNISILLTTGASDNFAAKNIYDVAGNVCERTNEAYSSVYRVLRGGSTFGDWDGYRGPAADRTGGLPDQISNSCISEIGFRPALYVK